VSVGSDNLDEAQIIADRYARDLGQNARFYDRILRIVNAQEGKGRRKLYQLHGRSLLRIGCHMTIDSLSC
jgi:hypothetical protein